MTKHPDTAIVAAVCATCGTSHVLRTTAAGLTIDVCSNCHAAYTGVARTTVAGTRIERFNRRRSLAAA